MTEIKFFSKRKLLIGLSIIIALLAILFSINRVIGNIAENKLRSTLDEELAGCYIVDFGELDFNLWARKVKLKDINLQVVNDSLSQAHLNVNYVLLDGLKIGALLSDKRFFAHQLIIDSPQVATSGDFDVRRDSVVSDRNFRLPEFEVEKLNIQNASFIVFGDSSCNKLNASGIDVELDYLRSDTMLFDKVMPVSFCNLRVSSDSLQLLYDTIGVVSMENLKLVGDRFDVATVSVRPFYSEAEFLDVKKPKNAWLSFVLSDLKFIGFHWDLKMDRKLTFEVEMADFGLFEMDIINDKRYKKETSNKLLMADLMRELPVLVQIDTLKIKKSAIEIGTRPANNDTIGRIYFDQVFVTGYNVHNYADRIERTEFDMVSRFMDEATIKASLSYDVNDAENRFRCKGRLGNLSTTALNKILSPLAGVETAGQIHGIDFNILGDDKRAVGTVDFEYENLKVEVLNSGTGNKDAVLSALSNFALKKHNIKSHRRFRQGTIEVERDESKAIFGFIWDAVKDGLIDTLIPFDLDKERKIRKKLKKLRK